MDRQRFENSQPHGKRRNNISARAESCGGVVFTKEPTSKRVDLQQPEAMQWLRDLTLHSGQGYDDDDDKKDHKAQKDQNKTFVKFGIKNIKISKGSV